MSKAKKVTAKKEKIDNAVERLRQEFRKWYGTISVAELTSNRMLVFEIEELERMLAQSGMT